MAGENSSARQTDIASRAWRGRASPLAPDPYARHLLGTVYSGRPETLLRHARRFHQCGSTKLAWRYLRAAAELVDAMPEPKGGG